ncbi:MULTISPECIES: DeoR/GlpR family DNA-binding transcription regulator [Maribacter]|jgi:DeoR family transcriptional regulator of aga operon|uniref:DeoR/GlpR family DNA-binding transcription regulator n=1 Tax=Maribacter TaxID=252356 RepID=UPI0030D6F204|tara:strand:- start:1292 stop:2065 length:774 start_codon:yes stop_codon:yes gene_type:complete
MKRHQTILDKLDEDKHVEVLDLCMILGVSAVTIRKDLKFLEEKGLLFRTHGGASLKNPYANDRSVIEKEKISVIEKTGIANAASAIISNNDSIIIASGTSVLALAKALDPEKCLTVVTSSLNIALELSRNKKVKVLQLGGFVRQSSFSVIGDYAIQFLDNMSCSKLFMGVDGIDLEFGLTTSNLEEARLNQRMINSSNKLIVLADSSKFGIRSFAKICPLNKIDLIITDKNISQQMLKKLEEKGISVQIVGEEIKND